MSTSPGFIKKHLSWACAFEMNCLARHYNNPCPVVIGPEGAGPPSLCRSGSNSTSGWLHWSRKRSTSPIKLHHAWSFCLEPRCNWKKTCGLISPISFGVLVAKPGYIMMFFSLIICVQTPWSVEDVQKLHKPQYPGGILSHDSENRQIFSELLFCRKILLLLR